ncbi:MAG: hypothetical protein ACREVA_02430 [Burkholderiales bacterium]
MINENTDNERFNLGLDTITDEDFLIPTGTYNMEIVTFDIKTGTDTSARAWMVMSLGLQIIDQDIIDEFAGKPFVFFSGFLKFHPVTGKFLLAPSKEFRQLVVACELIEDDLYIGINPQDSDYNNLIVVLKNMEEVIKGKIVRGTVIITKKSKSDSTKVNRVSVISKSILTDSAFPF